MRESTRRTLDYYYEKVMRRIRGGMLFGEPIDVGDIKMLVVAAWALGEMEGGDRFDKRFIHTSEGVEIVE